MTLAQQARDCLTDSGVEHELAMRIIINMMRGSIENLAMTASPIRALTGPIQRGDVETVKSHLALLTGEQAELYAALGRATVELVSPVGSQELMRLFTSRLKNRC